jgi:hypothetical protein
MFGFFPLDIVKATRYNVRMSFFPPHITLMKRYKQRNCIRS